MMTFPWLISVFHTLYWKLCFWIIPDEKCRWYVIKLICICLDYWERLFIHTVVNVWSVKKYLNQALICFKLFVYLSLFKVIFGMSINRRQRNNNESIMRSFHSFKQRDYSYWFVKKTQVIWSSSLLAMTRTYIVLLRIKN